MKPGTSRVTTASNQRLAQSTAKLLDQVGQSRCVLHNCKRFNWFRGRRHPLVGNESAINQSLTNLAVNKKIGASTRNQASSAILLV